MGSHIKVWWIYWLCSEIYWLGSKILQEGNKFSWTSL